MGPVPGVPTEQPPGSGPGAPQPPASAWVAGTETAVDRLRPKPAATGDNFLTKALQNRYLGWAALGIAIIAPFVDGSSFAIGVMTNALIFVMLAVAGLMMSKPKAAAGGGGGH